MNRNLPSSNEALRMLRDVGCKPNVIAHCVTVMKVATKLAEKIKRKGLRVDVELVRIGALLHDIGRSKTHDVDHAIVGGKIARSLGLPESIIHIIERHVGGGITQEEAEELGWPKGIYAPQTLEEKIVTYADKIVDGSKVVPLETTLDQLHRKLGHNHPAIERIKQLQNEILSLVSKPPPTEAGASSV